MYAIVPFRPENTRIQIEKLNWIENSLEIE